MKRLILSLLTLFMALPAFATSYSVPFTASEVPLSQNGIWLNGKTNGLGWSDCNAIAGFVFGTQTGAAGYNDSICTAAGAGTWGPNQSVTVVVKFSGTNHAAQEETEAHINTTITANSITGYEGNCSMQASNPYMQIVRWNGPLATTGDANNGYTSLGTVSTSCANSDSLTMSRNGATITLTRTPAGGGTPISVSATDSTYLGGAPGVGFYMVGLYTGQTAATANQDFGISSFSATDGAVTIGPTYEVELAWTNPNDSGTIEVQRIVGSSCPASGMTTLTTVAPFEGPYIDLNVVAGQTYSYQVLAAVNEVLSLPSECSTVSIPGNTAAATPIFSPAAGTYVGQQAVSITSSTPGASIYYTVNGSVPSSSSTLYSGPVSVSASETVNAIAIASGYLQSAVGTAAYTINKPGTPTGLTGAVKTQ